MSSTSQAISTAEREKRARHEPRALHPETVGDLLLRYRMAAELTQEELAEQAALSVRAIGDIERGAKRRPHRETIRLLAAALGLSDAEHDEFLAASRQRPAPAPTLAAMMTVPSNLPAQVTPLVGRAEAMKAACALFRRNDVRLLTIIGPGGVGKTRLAIAVADALRADVPDGVVFVPFATVRDAAFVPSALAQALEVRERAGVSLEAAIIATIGQKRLLLVLDNFEHLLNAAPIVGAVLAACPRLAALVTSRAPLHIYGEHEFPLEPLAVPPARRSADIAALARVPAVDLFIQRARAVRPDFRLTPGTADAVAGICRRLDGLPLALELAAARTRLLAPAELLERLGRRLHLLTTGPADRPPRQQTMRGAIAWSHDLLDEEEQRLFRRLAVFGGGWTVRVAEAICADDALPAAVILDRMEALLEHHLLRAEMNGGAETRVGMFETTHAYALEQLTASGERDAIERHHAAYYLVQAEEAERHLTGGEQAVWLTWLEAEHDNLRAALAWARDTGEIESGLRLAGALARFWYTRGYQREGGAWLADLLARSAGSSPHARAKALYGAALLAYVRADYAHALDLLGGSVALWQEIGDQRGLADALTCTGATLADMGEYARAAAAHEESLALQRASDDQAGISASLNNLANIARHQGERARALAFYDDALAIRRMRGDTMTSAVILQNIGQLLREMGDYPRAEAALTESIALHGGTGDQRQIALAVSSLGTSARDRGDYAQAWTQYDRCLALFRELGSKADIARTLIDLARIAHESGDDACAAMLAEEGLVLARATHHQRNTAHALLCTADIIRRQGMPEMARTRYIEGLQSFHAVGDPFGMTEAVERLGLLAVARNDVVRAARLLGFCAAMRVRMGTPIPPVERDAHACADATLRQSLGADAVAAAWAAGAALTLEDVIADVMAGAT
ncbi:MAG: tetratricopeptide repeat protein [Thermomicrobia bacterium]|nr:tetratricopeptide repeat protein [Thermomicrobia bacterium]